MSEPFDGRYGWLRDNPGEVGGRDVDLKKHRRNAMVVWYAVVRPDNGYPVLIYPEKERAELVASKNGYEVVAVVPAGSRMALNESRRTIVLSAIPIQEPEPQPVRHRTPWCSEKCRLPPN
jgi:hypothetical protein